MASTATAHADHQAHVQHHFVSSEQQFDSAKMGMWLFLITEILLFSGMFVAYAVYRVWYPEMFDSAAQELLDPFKGALNTIVLLGSSLTVAMAIRFIQDDEAKKAGWALVVTVLLAGVFMVIKYFEYTHKIHEGILPGVHYSYEGLTTPYVGIFMSIYFVMTGIHGLHVVIGMVILSVIAFRTFRGDFSSEYYTYIELSALYWHLVDIVWIFVFPLIY
ncbi:MAG: cytochrome c oxidase subunit 3 family protein, partial [Bacteroidota bacterium]